MRKRDKIIMIILRKVLGDVLRAEREYQNRTLRDVSETSMVSLGYLSEVERGFKEVSSEILNSICASLYLSTADVLEQVATESRRRENLQQQKVLTNA